MMNEAGGNPMQEVPGILLEVLARIGREGRDIQEVRQLKGTGNKSHMVSFSDDRIVVRFEGNETGGLVDRELEHRHGQLAARQGLGPEILYVDRAEGILITRFVDGIRFDDLPRPFARASLGRLAKLIAKLQASDGFSGVMDPWKKVALYLDDAEVTDPGDARGFGSVWPLLEILREKTAIDLNDLVPCHIDPVAENLFDREQGAILLDWEYAARSHRLWDLAYFASEASLTDSECATLLEESGQGERLDELHLWMAVAKSVSFAWCLARRARASAEGETWDMALVERRIDLQRCLNAH